MVLDYLGKAKSANQRAQTAPQTVRPQGMMQRPFMAQQPQPRRQSVGAAVGPSQAPTGSVQSQAPIKRAAMQDAPQAAASLQPQAPTKQGVMQNAPQAAAAPQPGKDAPSSEAMRRRMQAAMASSAGRF